MTLAWRRGTAKRLAHGPHFKHKGICRILHNKLEILDINFSIALADVSQQLSEVVSLLIAELLTGK